MANFPHVDTFNDSSYGNPEGNQHPDLKIQDTQMFLDKARWLYSVFINGSAGLSMINSAQFSLQRRYDQGDQPNAKYSNILDPLDPTTNEIGRAHV